MSDKKNNFRKLKQVLNTIMDPKRPIYLRSYSSREDLQLYKFYIHTLNKAAYQFHPLLVDQAQAILDANEHTVNIKATLWSIPLPYHEAMTILHATSDKQLYDPHPTNKGAANSESSSISSKKQLEVVSPLNQQTVIEVEGNSLPIEIRTKNASRSTTINYAIEQLIDNKESEDEPYSKSDKEFIRQYHGYQIGPASTDQVYSLPSKLIQITWKLALKHGYEKGRVFEPHAGRGQFLDHIPLGVEVYALVDSDYSQSIMYELYPEAAVNEMKLAELFVDDNLEISVQDQVEHLPSFDLIIGHPPLGVFEDMYEGMGEKNYSKAKTFNEYYIFRGLDLLTSGGLLVLLLGTRPARGEKHFLQDSMTATKKMIRNKAALIDAYRITQPRIRQFPDIQAEIIVLRKLKTDTA